MKVNRTKEKLVAHWDNQKYRDEIKKNDEISDEAFSEIFKGNFRKLWTEYRVEARQYWFVNIDCDFTHDGINHNINLNFDFDKPMKISEIIGGDEDIKLDGDSWIGVEKILETEMKLISEDVEITRCNVHCEATGWVKKQSAWNILNNSKLNVA